MLISGISFENALPDKDYSGSDDNLTPFNSMWLDCLNRHEATNIPAPSSQPMVRFCLGHLLLLVILVMEVSWGQ